jgi:hypothetical protein
MESTETTPTMYAAILVYVTSNPTAGYEPLYEETVTLIQASSEEHAAERAREFARARETSYQNEMGETITWSFKHLVDVNDISDEIGDGAEIYTRHFRDYKAYSAFEMLPLTDEASDRRREDQAAAQPGDS